MPTQITGTLASQKADGTSAPLTGAVLFVSPSSNAGLRIQYGGSGAFIPVVPNTALRAPHQYGFDTLTDGSGVYDFKIPKAAEIRSLDPSLKWNIALPDGTVYTGAPLSVNGPVSLDDLIQTYSWVQTQRLQVTAPLAGTEWRQTVSVAGATYFDVVFAGGGMPSAVYQVSALATRDSVTSEKVIPDVTNKTMGGFRLNFDPAFTGSVDVVVRGG